MSPAAASKKPFPPGMPVGEGDIIAGKYRVEELVAVGGMGVVVSARHLSLGQTVAIKVLLPIEVSDDASSAIPRFLREARAAAGLKSEHVVRIFDVDTLPSGLPYMVMERLSGQDLRRVVKGGGPLPVEQAVDFVLQAADAIGEAHSTGIVHRDLKPSNLFLTHHTDGRPWVKVLDFGISKASHDPTTDTALTVSRAMIGSPMYMSPEQVRDAKSVDGRSDIWSLGVILHELLTAKPAFRGESLPAICAAIAADQPQSLAAERPDVPPALVAIVERCLEKDPARRFQSVDELRAALQPFLGRFAPTVPVPPPSVRSGVAISAPISGRVPLGSSGSIDVASGLVSSGASSSPTSIRIDGNFDRASDPDAPTLHRDVAVAPFVPSDAPFSATGVAPARRSRLPLVLGITAVALAVALALGVGKLLSSRKDAAANPPAASSDPERSEPGPAASEPMPVEVAPRANESAVPVASAEPAPSAVAPRPVGASRPRTPEPKPATKKPDGVSKPGDIRLSR